MKRILLKLATSASAIAMATVLSTSPIMAAEYIYVDDGTEETSGGYTWDGKDKSGAGWNWTNNGDDLNLNDYNGYDIYAEGNLNINVTGTNTVTMNSENLNAYDGFAIEVDSDSVGNGGNLTINGNNTGTLNVVGEKPDRWDNETVGIGSLVGNVTVKDCNVNVKDVDIGILTTHDEMSTNGTEITIDHSNVSIDANESAMVARGGLGAENAGKINIINNSEIVFPEGNKVIYVTYISHSFTEVDAMIGKNDVTFDLNNYADSLKALEDSVAKSVVIKVQGEDVLASSTAKSDLVQTGVMTDMSIYVTGSIAAAGVASILISFKKRK